MWRRGSFGLALFVLAFLAIGAADCPHFTDPVPIGVLTDERITEVSGIAAGRLNPGIFWIHEDSGAPPTVYAVSPHGDLLAGCTLAGTAPVDCEDIAVGPGPNPGKSYIYLADIRDNGMRRRTISIYRFPEPRLDATQMEAQREITEVERFDLVYPDRPHDAETLLVDPASGVVYVITKWDPRSRVYRARLGRPADAVTLEYIGDLRFNGATGGDVSPDGRWVIIRTYFAAYVWRRDPGTSIADVVQTYGCPVPLAREPQGEAICFARGAEAYVTISEVKHPLIYLARRVSG